MQAYFGERAHFDQASAILDQIRKGHEEKRKGVLGRNLKAERRANMAGNLLDRELIPNIHGHTKNACKHWMGVGSPYFLNMAKCKS